MRHAALVLVLVLVLPGALRAQNRSCSDPQLSMVALGACMDSAYARADRDLNGAYQAALATLSDTAQRAALVRSERAWIAYRDAQRALRDDFAGGNHPSMEVLPSMTAMVEARARFLHSLASEHYPAVEKACP